jgi:hypothetical protein
MARALLRASGLDERDVTGYGVPVRYGSVSHALHLPAECAGRDIRRYASILPWFHSASASCRTDDLCRATRYGSFQMGHSYSICVYKGSTARYVIKVMLCGLD